jgi:restriction system protein
MEYLNTVDVPVASGMARSTGSAASEKKQVGRMCPDCGASMVVRVAKKGAYANKPFWGCSTYPKCKAIVAYTDKV